ncbi:MAG: glutathione S-transferase N-terminal domain-containing protein, partial [Gammaproteobacteria bacterium]|nr:glutathione S-transferase N-terminal domain-containing protein [Gammaproteobacteria bacterium]
MILYCVPACIYCHRVRIVLLEKNVTVEIRYINP